MRVDRAAPRGPWRLHGIALFRFSGWDVVPVGLSLIQGGLVAWAMTEVQAGRVAAAWGAAIVAVGLWWGSNTVAHIHIHTPFFRGRRLNRGIALYLTALLGVPQSLWRARHLWHHAGEPADRPARVPARALAIEIAVLGTLVAVMVAVAPDALAWAWLPGWLIGLGLCQVHGHFEHAGEAGAANVGPHPQPLPQNGWGRGAGGFVAADPGVSCYHRLYNRLWLNDGYHAEHHRRPGLHWTRLPDHRLPGARASVWPPVLRWLHGRSAVLPAPDRPAPLPQPFWGRGWGWGLPSRLSRAFSTAPAWLLDRLEYLALASPRVQRWLVARHAAAMRAALAGVDLATVRRVCVVGGGRFPRTVLVVQAILPAAAITVVESNPAHIAEAEKYLAVDTSLAGATCATADLGRDDFRPAAVAFRQATFVAGTGTPAGDADLVVVPLGYRGDRGRLYSDPPARLVLVHDWLWRPCGRPGVVVARRLLKRLNLVVQP